MDFDLPVVADPSVDADLALLLEHRPSNISGMFDSIADHYDRLDRLLSAGLDEHWRSHLVRDLGLTGSEAVLDLCSGTGEVALSLRRCGAAAVTAVDFAPEMLKIAESKARNAGIDGIRFICADALHIPLGSASVDVATMAFGLRNVEDPLAAIAEISRVLRPGGRLSILELSRPPSVVRRIYLGYFEHVLPWVGRLLSHHRDAYRYLPASVEAFPPPAQVAAMISAAGFEHIHVTPVSGGVAHCYSARKPKPEA
ncbi:bifunctional demethylmenaquinone methyltransferase/2-methoxy-6-polyprenyl-1,4-benzoquinol methylase UbiE [Microlunatus sp. Gsoil 973]|uniref:bifunctional demethylmenaquinone methyltransferase/2-methoxy-6-polyprenyl-1,4-benzoquinol methylase UbiE n=1 Tax=Microlunatus sp. Gsoil 973 TaxID=2672569 RepID=UPI0012B4C8B2|nr:bifunctional demethylmenaquinone methyltransferase/2-methoxy-6-polyprenyl-1,4-benzoquinol methylase UbiE [Microlunatus sp. Gsoil 973]QGN33939.1 bifunctional demethylmenaquinone methyltransferase/2-methoxy-6-polyprenyl-1,4-benzoquinol methylase UbiE [Microlunatus sp. Gsoil 973]